jgi:hypothetical protein
MKEKKTVNPLNVYIYINKDEFFFVYIVVQIVQRLERRFEVPDIKVQFLFWTLF